MFLCLGTAALAGMFFYASFRSQHRGDETTNVIRLVAGIFVVMTSLVLGLMLNTAKNRFDGVNRDVHAFATELILLERNLRLYGPEADASRERLKAYAEFVSKWKATSYDPTLISDPLSEDMLNHVGKALRAISPPDSEHLALWNNARQDYERLVSLRWAVLQQSEGSIPVHMLVMVTCWLTMIFASFGYGAPRNAVVVISLILAAALIAATIDLILELDSPFYGSITMSPRPIQRVLDEMRR